MITLITERSEEALQFCADPWPFQQTFKTPLKDLNRFVTVFLALFPLEMGTLCTDEVVFEPEKLQKLFSSSLVQVENIWHFNISVQGKLEIAELLEAALGDWVGFVFVSSPESFAIYADHDEYTTFYTSNKTNLVKLVSGLVQAGFEPVVNYLRGSSADRWR